MRRAGAGLADGDAPRDDRPVGVRFLAALGRLSIRLLPEYLLLVVAPGAFRGVLFPLGSPLVGDTGGGDRGCASAGVAALVGL